MYNSTYPNLKTLFLKISSNEVDIVRIYNTTIVVAAFEVYIRVFRNILTVEIENYVHTWYQIRLESVSRVPSSPKSRTEWKQSSRVRFGAFEPRLLISAHFERAELAIRRMNFK